MASLPERLQKRTRGQWRRGKSATLAKWREELGTDTTAFDAEVTRQLDAANTKGRKKDKQISREDLLNRPFNVRKLDQRAAFARHLLKQAFDEVMAGKHPKEEGNCLFVNEKMRQAQLQRTIAQQTNNHLIRHRLLILERLLKDILKEYASDDKARIGRLTIEVNRDLREMSGKSNYEKQMDLNNRIKNHHSVVEYLHDRLPAQYHNRINGSLIRKARVAADLDWTCPYTNETIQPIHLITKVVDLDHIIPRILRPSDSLDSLVVTFSTINRMKGKRTAWQFVKDEETKDVSFQGEKVEGMPNLKIRFFSDYRKFVDDLKIKAKGEHKADAGRRESRQKLLRLPTYEEKGFLPRDLTQTSQLVRLGAQALKRAFLDCENQPVITSMPGSVTGEVRKAWDVTGCLELACPEVMEEVVGQNGKNVRRAKKKQDIRDITHLHHALDACVLVLSSHFIRNDGRIWELIVKRNPDDAEKRELIALGVFGFGLGNRFGMRDLDDRLKDQIRQRLAEKRVVQHVPARMDGLRVEQNTWRVVGIKDGDATLQQRIRQADGSRPIKRTEEKITKLLGLETGKLSANKGVLVIPDNFGVALDPEPTIIPFHKVWKRLNALKKANGGKMPRVLRNGQLIRVPEGRYKGVWKVFSAKNNASGMAIDFGTPDVVRLRNKMEGHKINVLLASLMKSNLKVLSTPLTGTPAN